MRLCNCVFVFVCGHGQAQKTVIGSHFVRNKAGDALKAYSVEIEWKK